MLRLSWFTSHVLGIIIIIIIIIIISFLSQNKMMLVFL